MRIAIDARVLRGWRTGVGRLLHEILRGWTKLPAAAAHEIVLCASEPVDLAPYEDLRITAMTSPGAGTVWEQLALPPLLRRARADVLFSPSYTAPLRGHVPTVVAIHDVSYAAHPEWYRWRHGARLRVISRLAARKAARIMTISEFSKREIVALFDIDPTKITVIPLGLTRLEPSDPLIVESSQRSTPALSPPPAPVLFVGTIFNRRHVPEMIDGFARLAAAHSEVSLDIVGQNRTFPTLKIRSHADASGAGDRIRLRAGVPDDELSSLYARARAFMFLSDYEGFGLTPLEALGSGVPVVVLDTPVSREVYGDAALYVARAEPALIHAALERIVYDDEERERVLAAARVLLPRYSWERCAAEVLELLTA